MDPQEREQALAHLHTVRDWVRWAASRFREHGLCFGHGTDNAWDEAAYLIAHALYGAPEIRPEYADSRLTPAERAAVLALLERRIDERMPAAYLTGEAWFAGLPFAVDARVLVPRSPFAELLERGLSPWIADQRIHRVLDFGTGSGCIAAVAAMAWPAAAVDAVDASDAALDVARSNIKRHGLGDRVRVRKAHALAELGDAHYNVILSNPPYVPSADVDRLPEEYRHEPRCGLDGGADGFDVVREILRGARARLADHGVLVVEVGEGAVRLQALYPRVPFLWLEFERGGDGVFLLTAEQLDQYRSDWRGGAEGLRRPRAV